jgi:predicted AAA+ superfamily ATPase
MVKIIVGVRRCGKSYVLDMIGDELIKKGIKQDHIIYRLFTSVEVEDGYSKKDMFNELVSLFKDSEKYYLLLDEVQEVDSWEQTINSLFEKYNVDIYVTGSNSKLTSEKISSYLSGRYISIPIYTLSFKEYIEFAKAEGKNLDDVYNTYARTGGFPLIATSNLPSFNAYQIVEGIYHSIITKDITSNHPIKDIKKFNRVVKYIMDNMGNTFSANSIADYLKSQHREISVESVYNYITWLKEAFIIYECNRYDLQGKEVLKTQEKYYLSDISLRYALFGYNSKMDSSILENIIYLELKRRGYEVYVGKNGTKEIDFIAKLRDEEIHIQATVKLPQNSDREISNLMDIKDFNHKYVVTMDRNDVQNINGIQVIHIVDFLLMEKW